MILAPLLAADLLGPGVSPAQATRTARLAVNDPGDHLFELPVFTREWQVGCDLRGRVAQPHRVYVSGDHVGVRSTLVCAESHRRIERVLYMAAITAARHNAVIKEFYQRLRANQKPFKVAITACMRKLLSIVNVMVRDSTPWKIKEAPVFA